MAKRPSTAALLLLGLMLDGGCGSPPIPPPNIRLGPHGGIASRLPDDRGFAEIVNEPEVTDRTSRQPTSIVVYFLQMDGKTPLTPVPTDVRAEVALGRNRSEKVPLTLEARAGDPAGGSRFASKPGPHALQNIRGQLFATVGDRQVEIVFEEGR